MKHFSFLSFAIICIIAMAACSGSDAKKMLIGDTDKYNNTPKQAVEALFNTLPKEGNIMRLKEAVKFKENDKLSDSQKDEFFTGSATRLKGQISFSFQILDLYSEDRVYAEKTDLSEDEFKPYADTLILWSKSFPIIPDEELDALEDLRYTRLVPEDVK